MSLTFSDETRTILQKHKSTNGLKLSQYIIRGKVHVHIMLTNVLFRLNKYSKSVNRCCLQYPTRKILTYPRVNPYLLNVITFC